MQNQVLEKRSLFRSVSAQVLKVKETSSDQADVDLTVTLHPLTKQWRSLQSLVNMPVPGSIEEDLQEFEKNPRRWKSYSADNLGSLDTFSEGLGLSRDDVMGSKGDAIFEEEPLEAADNLINKLNQFRERLYSYVYSPEDAYFEVEQKLNISQKVRLHCILLLLLLLLLLLSS